MVSLNDNQVTTRPHVVVIGGGPAGATTSTLLAKQGHRDPCLPWHPWVLRNSPTCFAQNCACP
jgi:hypothetical protein